MTACLVKIKQIPGRLRPSRVGSISTLIAFVVLSACASLTSEDPVSVQQSANLGSEAKISNTGIQDDDVGIGGTGLIARGEDEERGLGGTGIITDFNDDRGLGGTGVVGTVTGFGSIWVNGLEVELTADLKINTPSGIRAVDQIEIGHVVEVLAYWVSGKLTARRLSLRPEVVGPVQAISIENGRMTVADQEILLDTAITVSNLRFGNMVAVYGLRRSDNKIQASLIESVSPDAVTKVRGAVVRDQQGGLRLGGLSVPEGTPVGMNVEVIGHFSKALQFETLSVNRLNINPFGEAVEQLSVEIFSDSKGQIAAFGEVRPDNLIRETVNSNQRVVVDLGVLAGTVNTVRSVIASDVLPGRLAGATRTPTTKEKTNLQNRMNQLRNIQDTGFQPQPSSRLPGSPAGPEAPRSPANSVMPEDSGSPSIGPGFSGPSSDNNEEEGNNRNDSSGSGHSNGTGHSSGAGHGSGHSNGSGHNSSNNSSNQDSSHGGSNDRESGHDHGGRGAGGREGGRGR
ncbi:DUF5666 domain-containing protein [Motiliproteus sp. MSK22-1]|uniref:DUF5666 domain-containing protein n=1 Tax=Motiliproteus sp. MSK22-1 TaxID=1897630 RepID=UPI000977BA29|nr:DUF5666 domain-containing protein [Motiliproteus sp. MSK22-1]OMH32076.1 hypothetical protein BGP75_15320 [Motiliproteus sp. MSK22-1]